MMKKRYILASTEHIFQQKTSKTPIIEPYEFRPNFELKNEPKTEIFSVYFRVRFQGVPRAKNGTVAYTTFVFVRFCKNVQCKNKEPNFEENVKTMKNGYEKSVSFFEQIFCPKSLICVPSELYFIGSILGPKMNQKRPFLVFLNKTLELKMTDRQDPEACRLFGVEILQKL